jgi:ribose transport system substrate-binding protein
MKRLNFLRAGGLVIALALAFAGFVFGESVDPDKALAELQKTALSKGPNGETPSPASSVTLTPEEIAKIKDLKAKAAIVMHYAGNDWSLAQVAGLKEQFGKMGIEVISVTDAGFKPEKQVADIETVLAQKPQIIVSIPTDPVSTADAYRKAAQQGVKLVFMDNVPKGLETGKEYVSVVSADNYGNGVAAAHLMAKALKGKGKIGLVFHAADFFVTRQRLDGFKKTIAENYPDIKIVGEQGIGGPDFSGDGDKAASALLTSNRDLNGIWAVWDVPAEGVISAARAAGKDNLVITTCDLGLNVAIDMAQEGFIKGLGGATSLRSGDHRGASCGLRTFRKGSPCLYCSARSPGDARQSARGMENGLSRRSARHRQEQHAMRKLLRIVRAAKLLTN